MDEQQPVTNLVEGFMREQVQNAANNHVAQQEERAYIDQMETHFRGVEADTGIMTGTYTAATANTNTRVRMSTRTFNGLRFVYDPTSSAYVHYISGLMIRIPGEFVDDEMYNVISDRIDDFFRAHNLPVPREYRRYTDTRTPAVTWMPTTYDVERRAGTITVDDPFRDDYAAQEVPARRERPEREPRAVEERYIPNHELIIIETLNLLRKRFLITDEQYRGVTDLIKNEGSTHTALELLKAINRGEF